MIRACEMPERYLIMSSRGIRANWDWIKKDPDNPRPELDCEEWIEEARSGKLLILGGRVVIQDKIGGDNEHV